MAEFLSNFIGKRSIRSSASSNGDTSISPEAKKLKNESAKENDAIIGEDESSYKNGGTGTFFD